MLGRGEKGDQDKGKNRSLVSLWHIKLKLDNFL